ncbi:protein AF-17-like [Polyodon spathula]|uniref:protein AF-17-like n=1 Tax=Polyodon spathula TaxID=7913 RepID=UPI001B7F4B0E|nr:protein AF-17-like [Polyodon spathula]
MEYNCNAKDGAFQTGYQEIEGINMGFLRINGRQMFALAQVFSDLFKDIPRTTVNKRMEVLNIRSRRCDIQELRTLKAIHSVPVRAVKCSLITKEDLEALCVACQSLSPKKRRKKRKCKKTETENDISPDALCTRICKKKHSVAKTLLAKDTAGLTVAGAAQRARRLLQVPHSKPAQNFSKSKNTRSSLLLGPVRKDLRNYEKVAKGRNCYSLKGVNGILPQAFVGTYPNKTLHSAIATNDCSKTSLPLCLKGKDPCYSRYEEYSNGCVKKHNSPALLVGNKTLNFASKKGNIGAVSAGGLKKAHCTQGTSAGYSSDSESSLDFEKDSDFGSSFQSTSTDSSDEDGRSALSSSSEEGSSSESDSSSVCSGDSVQSTRYRQAALPTPISRFPLPSGRDAARLPEEAAVATCKIPAKRFTSTEPPLKIKTEPLCLDPGFLLLEQHGRRWATHTPTATTLKPPAFNCLKETIKTEPSWAVTTGSCLTAETEKIREHATAFIGDRAKQGGLQRRPQRLIESPQQKAPSLDPEGGFEAALPPLKKGNYLHKGAPDNVTSLSIGDQAESQIKDLSSESAFQNAASCSSGAPIQTAVQNFTGTDRICIVADPVGDIKEQRKDKFERLIRTSKLWCYAKGFNFDGNNVGYATAAAYEAAARLFKRIGTIPARSGSRTESSVWNTVWKQHEGDACYGIVQVPTGPWFCRKCESQERAARVRCELCPHKDGALKRTDNGGWAHVVCALYIPEVQFANVLTMEPIVLQYVPHDRYNKTCYICEDHGRESRAASGACMTCNRQGCRQAFHVTCAQMAGLLCEEEGLEADNVKYCGYCKYHYNKMKKPRPVGGGSGPGGGSFCHTRRSTPASPPQEKHSSHQDKPRKNHKDKARQKEKHKKLPDGLTTLVPPVSSSTDKVASSHHVSPKESAEVSRSEVKGKKTLSNAIGHHGRKLGSRRSSSSPFQQGTSVQQEYLHFSSKLEQHRDEEEEEEEKEKRYLKPPLLPAQPAFPPPPPLTPPSPSPESPRGSPPYESQPGGNSFEPKVTISTFGSIMRFTTSSGPPRPSDAPQGDCNRQPPKEGPREPAVKEKKHRGNKRSKHGPGRPRGSKNKDSGPPLSSSSGLGPPPIPRMALSSSSFPSSCRSYSLSTDCPLLGSGIYTSNKDPISLGGGGLGAVCSTPLSSSLLGHQGVPSLPQLSRSSLPGTISTPTTASATQVFSLPGSSYSLTSAHIFGSSSASGPSINQLISQSENSLPELDLEDCRFPCRDRSPQDSSSSLSPMSSLPLLFDQRERGGCRGNAPATTSQIDQLLHKHSSGQTDVNIVEMLKSLHSLQQENQRLQDQIINLTAKKESLQVLNVQLAVPFPPVPSSLPLLPPSSSSSQLHYHPARSVCSPDPFNISKSAPSKTSFLMENSLSGSSEDQHSGCPSRSSSSLSFQSTPPPHQSPASLSQPLVNGLARGISGALGGGDQLASPALPMVGGLMRNLSSSPQMPMNGIMGNLSGVIQTPATAAPQTHSLAQQNMQLANNLNSITDQERQFLLQQQQLHQLLTSQHFTPMLQQQQRQREIQRLHLPSSPGAMMSSPAPPPLLTGNSPLVTSLPTLLPPGKSLLTPAMASPVLSGQGNPFLGLQQDGSMQKSGRGDDKGGPLNQEKS